MEGALNFYRQAFAKSRLQISSRLVNGPCPLAAHHTEDVNFVPLPDWNGTYYATTSYDTTIPHLKRALLSLPRNKLGPAGLTEKTW